MKKFFSVSLIIIALLCGSTQSYAQTVFIFDNFENPIFDPLKWSSIILNTQTSLVKDNSNLGAAGSQSAQQMYLAGWTDGGKVTWVNIGKAQLPSHALVEYDFKLSSNFHFPLGQKMWRTMPNMNTGIGPNDTHLNMQMNSYGTTLTFEVSSYSQTFGFQAATIFAKINKPSVNTWHRIGWRFKKNTFNGSTPNADGQTEIFFDGVSVGSKNNVRLTASPTIWVRDYWGGPGNYTSVIDNNPIPQDQWIRIDNFKITDLGGGSVPPPPPATAPPPPSGLVIQ